jgi:hypothetical protein
MQPLTEINCAFMFKVTSSRDFVYVNMSHCTVTADLLNDNVNKMLSLLLLLLLLLLFIHVPLHTQQAKAYRYSNMSIYSIAIHMRQLS